MRLGIMQPYFFPYLGYYSLLKHVDRYIYLDNVQYIYHGWMDRNRILKQNQGWQYIKVPVKKHKRDEAMNKILINNEEDWKQKILNQMQHYKKQAPFYVQVKDLVEGVFLKEYNNLVDLNLYADKLICEYLNITTPTEIFSEMNLEIDVPTSPDEWALNICKSIGSVSEYWNAPGGKDFFDMEKYKENNIDLKFVHTNLHPYRQKGNTFEGGLSILDVMMFNSPEEINMMLDDYVLK